MDVHPPLQLSPGRLGRGVAPPFFGKKYQLNSQLVPHIISFLFDIVVGTPPVPAVLVLLLDTTRGTRTVVLELPDEQTFRLVDQNFRDDPRPHGSAQ